MAAASPQLVAVAFAEIQAAQYALSQLPKYTNCDPNATTTIATTLYYAADEADNAAQLVRSVSASAASAAQLSAEIRAAVDYGVSHPDDTAKGMRQWEETPTGHWQACLSPAWVDLIYKTVNQAASAVTAAKQVAQPKTSAPRFSTTPAPVSRRISQMPSTATSRTVLRPSAPAFTASPRVSTLGQAPWEGAIPTDLAQIPEFMASAQQVADQAQAEGADALDTDSRVSTLVTAYRSLTGYGVGADEALSAAAQYVSYAQSVQGAAQAVSGLVSAFEQGAPAPQIINAVNGVLVGVVPLAVAAGIVTAGVGAAVVAAVTLLGTILADAGLFGGAPSGVEVCPGTYCNPTPSWVANCCCFWGDTVPQATSSAWRNFPDPKSADDSVWFQGRQVGTWKGVTIVVPLGPPNDKRRPIDYVWPQYHHMECDAIPGGGPADNFRKCFASAWKAANAQTLNGLKAPADWQVLVNTLRMWNRAHPSDPSKDVAVSPSSSPVLDPTQSCPPGGVDPYFSTLIQQVIENSQQDAPGNQIVIHGGGPTYSVVMPVGVRYTASGATPAAPKASASSSSPATTAAVATGAAAAAAGGFWLAIGRPPLRWSAIKTATRATFSGRRRR